MLLEGNEPGSELVFSSVLNPVAWDEPLPDEDVSDPETVELSLLDGNEPGSELDFSSVWDTDAWDELPDEDVSDPETAELSLLVGNEPGSELVFSSVLDSVACDEPPDEDVSDPETVELSLCEGNESGSEFGLAAEQAVILTTSISEIRPKNFFISQPPALLIRFSNIEINVHTPGISEI